jgi:hypothetical protein
MIIDKISIRVAAVAETPFIQSTSRIPPYLYGGGIEVKYLN